MMRGANTDASQDVLDNCPRCQRRLIPGQQGWCPGSTRPTPGLWPGRGLWPGPRVAVAGAGGGCGPGVYWDAVSVSLLSVPLPCPSVPLSDDEL